MIGSVIEVKKARKSHTCWWCGEQIEKGHPYIKWVNVDGNDFFQVKVHPECQKAWITLPAWENEVQFAEFKRGTTEER